MTWSRHARYLIGLTLVVAFLGVACSGSADSDGAEPTAFDPDTAQLTRLIFWDEFSFGLALDRAPSIETLFQELLASDSPAAVPYLTDLAILPNTYTEEALEVLQTRFDSPFARNVYEVNGLFQARDPVDDSDSYLTFKQKLYALVQPAYFDFLNPREQRTISAQEIAWGSVAVDGIPPLESPRFVTADVAQDWMNPRDDLIGVVVNGDARAYPIRIIAWHEMVNDTIGGVPVSLAYCTLCGSAIVYDGRIGDTVYDFGTSGLLYRSNKLMYDRQTDTLWEQFSGRPAWGPLVDDGLRLTVVPSVATTWQEWVAVHPDTVVLDIDTGFARDYSEGAAYAEYNASPVAAFNTPRSDDRLPEKAVVHVLEFEGQSVAYPIVALDERDFIQHSVGGTDLIVISTPDGSGARAYENDGINFASAANDRQSLTDTNGDRWTIREEALTAEDGRELARIAGRDTFWFAFVNLAQDGLLWTE